jgi:hypothetical protein
LNTREEIERLVNKLTEQPVLSDVLVPQYLRVLIELNLDIRELLQRSENRIGDFVRDFPDLERMQPKPELRNVKVK